MRQYGGGRGLAPEDCAAVDPASAETAARWRPPAGGRPACAGRGAVPHAGRVLVVEAAGGDVRRPVGLVNPVQPVRQCDVVRVEPQADRDHPGDERFAGVPASPADPADVDPARPRRGRQGRRAAGAVARGRGPAPAGAPPEAATGRPGGVGGVVAAAAPRPLVDLLRHPGDAAALAPPATRPALDLPAHPSGSAASRPRRPGDSAALGPGEPELGPSPHPGRVGWPGLSDRGQHGGEDPAPGRRGPGTSPVGTDLATGPHRAGPNRYWPATSSPSTPCH